MTNTLDVVVGGQYGSESKGRVTADLAQRRRAEGKYVVGVRVAGPNAGHVVIDANGNRYALRQIPVTMVSVPGSIGVIAAGSEIDPEVLEAELDDLERGGHRDIRERLFIDDQATILRPDHREMEGGNDGPLQNRIGSTGKGIGAARAERVWRVAGIARDVAEGWRGKYGMVLPNTAHMLNEHLSNQHGKLVGGSGSAVIIEGTQGYGLGLHAGHYPQCTSSDCRAIDFLAMAGVNPWSLGADVGERFRIWVVLRAYPIRVAGNSGPMKGETTWDELGLDKEYTTVTHKERRVGQWDPVLAKAAVEANGGGGRAGGPVRIALAMADQMFSDLAGIKEWDEVPWSTDVDDPSKNGGLRARVADWIDGIEDETGALVDTIGTGPDSTIWLTGRANRNQPPLFDSQVWSGYIAGSEL